MSFADSTQRMQDAIFLRLGEAMVWKSGGADPGAAVTVLIRSPDEIGTFGVSRAILPSVMLRVRANDVTSPAVGDIVVFGAVLYKVIAAPTLDPRRQVWACEAAEVTP